MSTTTKLITLSDIQVHRSISQNVNLVKQLNPSILEAQEFYLRPFLGDEFYLALVADSLNSFVVYGDLWNGSTYTCGGKQYINDGLKIMLVYYAYGTYLNNAQDIITPNGIVTKNNNDSTPTEASSVSRLYGQSISAAKFYEVRVAEYLSREKENYPLYDCVNISKQTGNVRITPIRKRK